MRIRLYSIRDTLLGVYLAPFSARADVEAVRQIQATVKDPQMSHAGLVTNPHDFELCYMATLDDETGEVFPEQHAAGAAPASLGTVARLCKPRPEPSAEELAAEFNSVDMREKITHL